MEAVFFDVDFTLIHPGPTFDGFGYQSFAARYGLHVEPSRFSEAVRLASIELDRKVLADLAVQDEHAFSEIANKAKAALAA